MASPDNTRNKNVLPLISPMVPMEPVRNTIIQEKTSTTPVRTAVPTSESMSCMPIFDRTAVIPANSAEPNANITHICHFLLCTSHRPALPSQNQRPYSAGLA